MTQRPHIKLQERLKGSINIHACLDKAKKALEEYGVAQYITNSECYISSKDGSYCCIYFSEVNEDIQTAFNGLKEIFNDEVDSNKIWVLRQPLALWKGNQKTDKSHALRINLNLDIDSFIAYMKERCIRRQSRHRTDERMPRMNDGESGRSTFIAEGMHLNGKRAEVFVNGELRSDFTCWIEEKSDAYIIHLRYNVANGYEERTYISKDSAVSPIYVEADKTDSLLSVDGKKLAVTFEGFDEWKSSKRRDTSHAEKKPTVIYTSNPTQRREHAATRMASVTETEDGVTVTLSDKQENAEAEQQKPKRKRGFILITNINHTDRNVLICDTTLDSTDIWLKLEEEGHSFDSIDDFDHYPSPIPEDTSLMYYTPRGEYDILRDMALSSPKMAEQFPPWEELSDEQRSYYES